jgi:pyochelin biosynthesis protein PchC
LGVGLEVQMNESSKWIRRFHPSPSPRIRLVCFPHAGGSASAFYPISDELDPGIELLAVQYPGRQDRMNEAVVDDIGALVDRVIASLRMSWEKWCDRPLALFGHSMGATVAFEVAARMDQEKDVRPVMLFASSSRAPSDPKRSAHPMNDEEILNELRALHGDESDILRAEELLELLMPVLRADYRALVRYRYRFGRPLSCPINVLIGDADPLVGVDEACLWRDHSETGLGIEVFSGGHFYLSEHPGAVARHLEAKLGAL